MEIRFMEERDLDQVTALEAACFSQGRCEKSHQNFLLQL